MEENNQAMISVKYYEQLLRAQERIAAVERLLATQDYVSIDEIAAILDIKKKERDE